MHPKQRTWHLKDVYVNSSIVDKMGSGLITIMNAKWAINVEAVKLGVTHNLFIG